MARGGRVIYKKASSRKRRRKARSKVDDDDEEYVLGEESGSDCESAANPRDFSDEASFEFSESDGFDDDDDDDDEGANELKIARSKKKKKRGNRKKTSVSDDEDEDDEDFSPDDDDFDEDDFARSLKIGKKRRSKMSKPKARMKQSKVVSPANRRRDRKIESSYDDFVVKDRVSVGRKRTKSKSSRKKRSDVDLHSLDSDFVPSDDDFVENDLVGINNRKRHSTKTKKTARSKGRRKKRSAEDSEASDSDFVISDEDDEYECDDDLDVKDQVVVDKKKQQNGKREKVGRSKRGRRRKRSSVVSDSLDSDFVLSEDDVVDDDFDLNDQVIASKPQKSRKEEKVGGSNRGRRRKRSSVDSYSSDSDFVISDDDVVDDDFDLNDRVIASKPQKNRKEERVGGSTRGRRSKRSVVDSESSYSDFVISDDDFYTKDQAAVDKKQNNRKKEKVRVSKRGRKRKRSLVSSDSDFLVSEEDDDEEFVRSKKERKKRTKPKTTGKRSKSSVDSDSETYNFDDEISEENVKEKPKRVFAKKKGKDKGKEKQTEDSGKQVCGICLSDERKSVVQGLLNCCVHYFCFACIMEWSKVESRCPLCKRRFATIAKLGSSDSGIGMRNQVIKVQKRDQVYQPSEEDLRGMLDPYESVVCMECQQGGDDNLMLLCDTCDSSAHTYCVGLGREVPEGNWYCECCRSVTAGLSHSQSPDTIPKSINQNLFTYVPERASANSPRPVSLSTSRSSSLRIDLNASPSDFPGEDCFVSSPISGSGAATVSGRRHIRQRIHVILSTNRQRQNDDGTNNLRPNSMVNLNPRPFFRAHSNLGLCAFNEGSSFRHVDGAKEEVQQMVKSHMKNLTRNKTLDRSAFKEIARQSTHTILAACGIEHRRNIVFASVEPPDNCAHDSSDGPTYILKDCCSACFSSFVKDVAQRLINN